MNSVLRPTQKQTTLHKLQGWRPQYGKCWEVLSEGDLQPVGPPDQAKPTLAYLKDFMILNWAGFGSSRKQILLGFMVFNSWIGDHQNSNTMFSQVLLKGFMVHTAYWQQEPGIWYMAQCLWSMWCFRHSYICEPYSDEKRPCSRPDPEHT